MVTQVPYTAQGWVTDSAAWSDRFWMDAGGQPVYQPHIVAAGQVLQIGSVMGISDTDGKLYFCDPAAANGEDKPFAILMENLDTSATGHNTDVEVTVLVFSNRGINIDALVAHTGWTKTKLTIALMKAGFFTRQQYNSAL